MRYLLAVPLSVPTRTDTHTVVVVVVMASGAGPPGDDVAPATGSAPGASVGAPGQPAQVDMQQFDDPTALEAVCAHLPRATRRLARA